MSVLQHAGVKAAAPQPTGLEARCHLNSRNRHIDIPYEDIFSGQVIKAPRLPRATEPEDDSCYIVGCLRIVSYLRIQGAAGCFALLCCAGLPKAWGSNNGSRPSCAETHRVHHAKKQIYSSNAPRLWRVPDLGALRFATVGVLRSTPLCCQKF